MQVNEAARQSMRAQVGPLKILLLDDCRLARHAVQALLVESVGAFVIDGDTGMDTATLLRRIEPDIALVSVGRGGGIDLVRRLLADRPSMQVLALSDRANAEVANRAMAAGATGCISKTAVVAELVRALEMVKKGERYVGPEIARSLVLSRFAGSADNPLSQAEREILHLVAEGKSLREIAATLHTPYKRLANACARLKSKVGARSMTELVAIACNLKTE